MVRTITTLIGGIVLGALAMFAFDRVEQTGNQPQRQVVRDIVDLPKMALEVADQHRGEHYANLDSIRQVVALPTEFARSEAIFAIAGRSNSATIQKMIFEADRVADSLARVDLLSVLFFRLAETDPNSALALAHLDRFSGDETIEQVVWRSWGRISLDEALLAAAAQSSATQRNTAAQSLYAAFGFLGNATTDRIEAELGIGPDRATRRSYLYALADDSPADAIAYINSLEGRDKRLRNVDWLSRYLALRNPAIALGYANLFAIASEGTHYRNIISGTMAYDNPRETIERMLASGENNARSGAYRSAMRALAASDIDAARQYFEQANSNDDRRMWGSLIAIEMAPDNPAEALQWARENDSATRPYIQMSVIQQIAQKDPQLALTEAMNLPVTNMRSSIVSMIIQQIAEHDPRGAATYLEQITDRNQKIAASQQLVYTWVRKDQDAAIEWLLGQDEQSVGQMIRRVGRSLLEYDIDAAIRLLPKLNEKDGLGLRQQIAQQLATSRSPSEAQSFIAQFSGEPGYDQLQAALIAGVAQSDTMMAKQMAAQIADVDARDAAYVQVIAHHAQTNPAEASRWLSSIVDENQRGAAAGQLASNWYANDPVAATHWVGKLPAGPSRDSAILQMSYRWGEPTPDTDRLIASIKNRDKRGQAKIRQIYSLMRTNPAEARKLLEDEDIPSYLRQQAEAALSQSGLRF